MHPDELRRREIVVLWITGIFVILLIISMSVFVYGGLWIAWQYILRVIMKGG